MLAGILVTIIGSFFSQTMLSFVGGDAMRIWYLVNSSINLKTSSKVIIIDRIIGLTSLVILFILYSPYIFDLADTKNVKAIMKLLLFSCISAIIIVSIFLVRIKATFESQLKNKLSTSTAIFLLSLSFLVQFCNILAVYVSLHCFNILITLHQCIIVMIPIILITMLPISVAGWGLREGVMIFGFGLLGITSGPVLAASIIFGLSLLISGLPGALVYLFKYKINCAEITTA